MSARELITEHLDLWTGAVTRKSSSGRGNNRKVELTGIKRLRELILELAVRGKLLEQTPSDTAAEELIGAIADLRQQRVHEGTLPKLKTFKPDTDHVPEHDIPNLWVLAPLGHLTLQITDGVHHTPNYLSSGVPFISVKDIDGRNVSFRDCKYISEEQHKEINKRCNPEQGDILLCRIGTLGRATIVDTDAAFSLFVSVGLLKMPTTIISSRYVHLALHSPFVLQQMDKIKAGGSHTNKLNLAAIPTLHIPVPPLEEQYRIVQKVDELMALCDRLEQQTSDQLEAHETLVETLLGTLTQSENATELANNWARLAAHFDTLFITEQSIDKLKQTILELAVRGRLVEQDAGDEPAIDFLTQIHTRKIELANQKRIKHPRELAQLDVAEHSYPAPVHWAWASFQDIADEISTGPFGSMIHKHEYVEGGIPLINPSHMLKGQIKEDSSISVTAAKAKELSSYKLASGDIVMARRGEVGRCAVITDREAGWLCGTGSFVLRFHPTINRQFILLLFSTDTVRDYLTGNSVGTTMTNLNHGILKKMPVALPSAEEQHRIVQKVDELMALCDQLKERLNQASETRNQMAEAVVEGALN